MTLALLLISIAYIFWLLSRNRILTLALERAHEKESRLVLEGKKAEDELKKYKSDGPFRAVAPIEPEVVEETPPRPLFESDKASMLLDLALMAAAGVATHFAMSAASKQKESQERLNKYRKILKAKAKAPQK